MIMTLNVSALGSVTHFGQHSNLLLAKEKLTSDLKTFALHFNTT